MNPKNDKLVGFTEVPLLDGIYEDKSPAEIMQTKKNIRRRQLRNRLQRLITYEDEVEEHSSPLSHEKRPILKQKNSHSEVKSKE